MKKYKIMFWVPAVIIFLGEGVVPALTSQSELAKEGIRHLGYPDYFGVMLTVFKVIGSLLLVLPFVPKRLKEWAFVGFGFDFICAFVSLVAVDGLNGTAFLPVFAMALLVVAYVGYHKMHPEI